MRKAYSIFRTSTGAVVVSYETLANGAMAVKFTDNTSSKRAIVIINPTKNALTYNLTGEWNLVLSDSLEKQEKITGEQTVSALNVFVYLNH